MSRWWGPNIEIDGSWLLLKDGNYLRRGVTRSMWGTTQSWELAAAETWESDVQQVLKSIDKNRVGQLLLQEINAPGRKKCKIIPIQAANIEETRARPADWSKAMKATERFAKCPNDDFCSATASQPGATPHSSLLRGTGEGSSVRVHYHPGAWMASHQMMGVDGLGLPKLGQEDVLFHELIHVYRAQLGAFEFQVIGGAFGFLEEFYAVVLTNIFLSEGRPDAVLRGDHALEFHSLQDAGQPEDASEFFQRNRTMIERLLNDPSMSVLMHGLTRSGGTAQIANWNPLRVARLARDMYSSLP